MRTMGRRVQGRARPSPRMPECETECRYCGHTWVHTFIEGVTRDFANCPNPECKRKQVVTYDERRR